MSASATTPNARFDRLRGAGRAERVGGGVAERRRRRDREPDLRRSGQRSCDPVETESGDEADRGEHTGGEEQPTGDVRQRARRVVSRPRDKDEHDRRRGGQLHRRRQRAHADPEQRSILERERDPRDQQAGHQRVVVTGADQLEHDQWAEHDEPERTCRVGALPAREPRHEHREEHHANHLKPAQQQDAADEVLPDGARDQ